MGGNVITSGGGGNGGGKNKVLKNLLNESSNLDNLGTNIVQNIIMPLLDENSESNKNRVKRVLADVILQMEDVHDDLEDIRATL